MISGKAFEARLASAQDTVSRHMIRPHLGDQEYPIALACDRAANEFLGGVHFRCVDQRQSERKASADRFLFSGLRVFSLCEIRRALAQCWDGSTVAKPYRAHGG